MRRLAVLVTSALAAGCGAGGERAELAVYDVEADLRHAAGGPIHCEAPLPCRGQRYAVEAEPALTEAGVAAARAPGPDTLLLDLTPAGARRLQRLLDDASRSGHHVAFVVDGEVLAYVAVGTGVSVEDGLSVATPRAKEVARRLDRGRRD